MRLPPVLASPWARLGLAGGLVGGVGVAVYFGGPDWDEAGRAFQAVRWEWVLAAVGGDLLAVVARVLAWRTVIGQALPTPHPPFGHVFSAFSVGLMANATLPGRVGELARVAVLVRHMPGRRGAWPTLVGSVVAHRVFDLFPVAALVVWVLATARLPQWAVTSLAVLFVLGGGLFLFALLSARHHHRSHLDGLGAARRLVIMIRHGLGVLRRPAAAAAAVWFQLVGWLCQLLAVWTAMRAFEIDLDLAAAGLVLVLMNVATVLPLWPGNVGLLQATIALPLMEYGIPYARGFAFGIGLQAIEASVGVGFGLLFLGREGLSFAALRRMPPAVEADEVLAAEAGVDGLAPEAQGAGARLPG